MNATKAAQADDMLEPLIYAAIMHNGKPTTIAEFQRAAANVADMLKRRASPTAAQEAWQPIETAPKDDRAYLVFDPHPGYIAIARWWLDGWQVGDLPGEEIWPTHWMPLPGHPGAAPQPAPAGLTSVCHMECDACIDAGKCAVPAKAETRYPHPDEDDAVTLWAEIHRLRAAVQGPDGYATWQDAATAERIRRVEAERKLAATPAPAAGDEVSDEQIKASAMEAFDSRWDADDETLVNKYGHGVYLSRFIDFARAVIAADRAARSQSLLNELRVAKESLARCKEVCEATAAAWRDDMQSMEQERKPLTDEQIANEYLRPCYASDWFEAGARYAERAHGIA